MQGGTIGLFSETGTAFTVTQNGNSTPFTSGDISGGSGTISGTLYDGEALNTTFYNCGTFEVNAGPLPAGAVPAPSAVPEPSTLAPFALAALGLGGLALKARKRRQA